MMMKCTNGWLLAGLLLVVVSRVEAQEVSPKTGDRQETRKEAEAGVSQLTIRQLNNEILCAKEIIEDNREECGNWPSDKDLCDVVSSAQIALSQLKNHSVSMGVNMDASLVEKKIRQYIAVLDFMGDRSFTKMQGRKMVTSEDVEKMNAFLAEFTPRLKAIENKDVLRLAIPILVEKLNSFDKELYQQTKNAHVPISHRQKLVRLRQTVQKISESLYTMG